MKIITLMENGKIDKDFYSAHGLSLYIETDGKKILFDLGPNNKYLKNALKLGVKIKDIDVLVISHGHFDHGNGLKKFLKINSKAKVYLSDEAFAKHYKALKGIHIPIGIKKPKDLERIHFIKLDEVITKNIKIYSNVEYVKQVIGDASLLMKVDGHYELDRFDHEIYLVIKEDDNIVLFSGCSHKGIENIILTIEKRQKAKFTHIIGGFHMSHYNPKDSVQTEYLAGLGKKLIKDSNSKFYSCHCTGDEAFTALKKQMDNNLDRIMTGTILEI